MFRKDERKKFYELLVRSHAADLYRFAFRLCGERETAQDLVQETYSEAWRSLDSLRETEKARAWLFTILRYRYAHLQRDSGRRERKLAPLELAHSKADCEGDDMLDKLASQDNMQKALDSLHSRFREPFLMVFLEGLSCAETARQLGVPLGTVLSRIHRARTMLRQVLDKRDAGTEKAV
jgi:RNA polymerase sigma-70 factor (ECF subfamily)